MHISISIIKQIPSASGCFCRVASTYSLSPPYVYAKTKQNKTLKGAKGASDTRLNRRSLLAGHPVSTTSLVSRSSSISEVDFCELDETEDALLEESSAGKRQSRNCSSSFSCLSLNIPSHSEKKKQKTFRLCTIAPTLIDCFLLTFFLFCPFPYSVV